MTEGMFRELKSSPLFSRTIRDQLVEQNMPLVASVAKKVKLRLPSFIDIEDLVHAGVIGLIQAIDKFDPDRGNKFGTFAVFLIRGRIYDYLRESDWIPHAARRVIKQIREAEDELTEELRRAPNADEVAAHLGLTEKRVRVLKSRDAQITISLNDACSTDENGNPVTLAEIIPDVRIGTPEEEVLQSDMVASVLRLAGYRDGMIMHLYHLEGLSMSQVACRMGLSEGRISQINKQVIKSVRSEVS